MGNESLFDAATAFLWDKLNSSTFDTAQAELHLNQVTELVPMDDDDWGFLSAQADDAASCLAYALRCLIKPEAEEAAWAARRAYETMDHLVIQDPSVRIGAGGEKDILQAPLIQAELKQQLEDLKTAKSVALDEYDLRGVFEVSSMTGEAFFAAVFGLE